MTEPKPVVLRGLRRDSLGTLWTLRDDGLWESSANGAVFPLAEVDRGPYGPTRRVVLAVDVDGGPDESAAMADQDVVQTAIAWVDARRGFLLDDPDRRATAEDLALIDAVDARSTVAAVRERRSTDPRPILHGPGAELDEASRGSGGSS